MNTRLFMGKKVLLSLSVLLCAAVLGVGTPLRAQSGGFVYVANEFSSTIAAYTMDADTGALTPVPGSPFPTGGFPSAIEVDPTGRFLYTGNLAGHSVSGFAISADTGALTEIPGSPFPTTPGMGEFSMAMDPLGRFVFVPTRSDGVYAYVRDLDTGALTLVPGSPFHTGPYPSSMTVEPSGQFAYVTNSGRSQGISAYSIDDATGALTSIAGSPFTAGQFALDIAMDPQGGFAYVTNYAAEGGLVGDVWGYSINPNTGSLTTVPGQPFLAGTAPSAVDVDPSGRFVYVTNCSGSDSRCRANPALNNVSAFTINPDTGSLTTVPGSPFPISGNPPYGHDPWALRVDPSGSYLYVCLSLTNGVAAFSINPDTGALMEIPGSPFPTLGNRPNSLAVTAGPQPPPARRGK